MESIAKTLTNVSQMEEEDRVLIHVETALAATRAHAQLDIFSVRTGKHAKVKTAEDRFFHLAMCLCILTIWEVHVRK